MAPDDKHRNVHRFQPRGLPLRGRARRRGAPDPALYLLPLVGLCAGLAFATFRPQPRLIAGEAAVASRSPGAARVIDGDTIELNGVRIRFSGIDAPEAQQRCAGAAVGQRATAHLKHLLSGGVINCSTRGQDRYGRTLADCTVGETDVSAQMVADGWAWDYVRYSGGAYAREQRAAQSSTLGVWALQCEAPWHWRRRQS